MNPKTLTETGWKAILTKNKIRDNGLQKALAAYQDLDEDDHDERLKGIALVAKLAGQLKRIKEVAENKDVIKYLNELEDAADAADAEERDVAKEKAATAKTEAANQKKAQAEERQRQKDEAEEEDEDGEDEEICADYAEGLLTALKKLKSMRGKTMEFIVCDARPFCGLMIAKRITAKHKAQLTEVTGGSKRFLQIGTCRADGDTYIFETDQSSTGLTRKLQMSVRNFTGKKLKIIAGDDAPEDEDSEPNEDES